MGPASDLPIAIVDMSLPEADVAAAFRKAGEDNGFFYLINHGIDADLLARVFQEAKNFFDLPVEEKMKVITDKNNRGYTPYLEQALDPKNSSQGDTKEGYYIGVEVAEDDPRAAKPLHGPNQWPSSELLPDWKATMAEYLRQMVELSKRFVPIMALSVNLPRDALMAPGMFDDPLVFLRPLHYTPEASSIKKGIFGAGAHTDWGVLTFLATDGVPGLQICREKDKLPQVWEPVPPMEGAYIVNIGDMLERWTNHRYRSTLHRVISAGQERYSVPIFFEPNFDCMVDCFPMCSSPTNPPRYPPITAGEYLLSRYRATHGGFEEKEP